MWWCQFIDWLKYKIASVPCVTPKCPESGKSGIKNKVTHSSHNVCRCSFVCTHNCSRQSRKAFGRFHHVDRENLNKDSGKQK